MGMNYCPVRSAQDQQGNGENLLIIFLTINLGQWQRNMFLLLLFEVVTLSLRSPHELERR